MYEPLLMVQLQHSKVGGAKIPHITPMKGNTVLTSYAAISDNLQMSSSSDKFAGHYMKWVWNLMVTLWGDLTNENNLPGILISLGILILILTTAKLLSGKVFTIWPVF